MDSARPPGARRAAVCLSIVLILIAGAAPVAADATVGDLHADDIVDTGDEHHQRVRFQAEVPEPGVWTFQLDTSGLPEWVSVLDASAKATGFSAEVTDVDDNETVIDLDTGNGSGDTGVTLNLTLDISRFETEDETEVTYVLASNSTGDQEEATFSITRPTAGSEDGARGDLEGRAVVYIAVETPSGERIPPGEATVRAVSGYLRAGGGPTVNGTTQFALEPGTWTLYADADGYAPGLIRDVNLQEGARDEPFVIQVQEGGTLQGMVRGTDGTPIENATVEITDAGGFRHNDGTDAAGRYEIMLAPGSYSLRAYKPGHGVSDESHVITIDSPADVLTRNFELKTASVESAELRHVGGAEPDMDAFDLQTKTVGGLVWVELGPDAPGETQQESFTPQDISSHGVDETTTFQIDLTVDRFDPDFLMWAAKDARWDWNRRLDGMVDITVRVRPVHLEMAGGLPRGPTVDTGGIDWPTGADDAADTSYRHAVQFGILEMAGLPPDVRRTVKGMSVTTNAQTFGFPQVQGGELSIYMAAPHTRVDGENHTGFYQVFLPDHVLEEWDVEDPEQDLEVMWAGDESAFEVEEVEGGARVVIDPVSFSDGTLTVRSTVYEETLLDAIPSLEQVAWSLGNAWEEASIWWALNTPVPLIVVVLLTAGAAAGGIGYGIRRFGWFGWFGEESS